MPFKLGIEVRKNMQSNLNWLGKLASIIRFTSFSPLDHTVAVKGGYNLLEKETARDESGAWELKIWDILLKEGHA